MPRGGWRGGGRPPKTKGVKRTLLGCRVKDEVRNWLYSEKERTGYSIGELVDLAVETLQKCPEKLPITTENQPTPNQER